MNPMKKLLMFLMFGALASCGPEHRTMDYDAVLNFKICDTACIADRVQRIDFLPLEWTQEASFRNADKTVVRNRTIYIWDYFSRKIVAYDLGGKVRFVLDRRGRGPGEYMEIRNFTVDDRYLYTVDNYRRSLDLYDCRTGIYAGSKTLPFFVSDIETLDNGGFLLAYVPTPGERLEAQPQPYRLFATDADLGVVRTYLPLGKGDCDPAGCWHYFTENDQEIIFGSFLFDGFTRIDRRSGERVTRTRIDFGREIRPDKRRDIEAVRRSGRPYMMETPLCCGDYVLVQVLTGSHGRNYLYDPATELFLENSRTTAENYLLLPVIGGSEGCFYSLLTDFEYYRQAVENDFGRMDETAEKRLAQGDCVLVRYTMK